MRLAVLVAIATLAPTAAADHAIGHVIVPGGEIVDLVGDAASEVAGPFEDSLPVESLPRPSAECHHRVDTTGQYFFGLPVPSGVREARIECRVGERAS